MATATAKKPRTSVEAVPQLATLPERVAVLEVKMTNLDEKMDGLRSDLCDNHNNIIETLKIMRDESTKQHNELAGKVKDLEGYKNKWVKYSMVGLAFAAGAGWIHADYGTILKFLGL
jgi:uncharacterized protein YycO